MFYFSTHFRADDWSKDVPKTENSGCLQWSDSQVKGKIKYINIGLKHELEIIIKNVIFYIIIVL